MDVTLSPVPLGPCRSPQKGEGGGALCVRLRFYTIFHINRYLPYSLPRLNMGGNIIGRGGLSMISRVNKVAKGQYMPAGTRLLRVPPSFSFNILIYHLVFIPSIILVTDKEKRGGSDIWGIFTRTNNQKERGWDSAELHWGYTSLYLLDLYVQRHKWLISCG